jgi:signal transduction histidine kinase
MDALQKMVNICKDGNNTGDFQPAHFNLHNLVIEVIDALEVHYQQKNINIINLVSETITVFVDRNMMLSILMNLLGNAIKFTNIGGKIEIISEEIEQNIWKISVKDNGIGINEQQMYNLIKKNQYYTTPGTMGESGTGLGLMLGIETEKPAGEVIAKCMEKGVLVLSAHGKVRLLPALNIPMELLKKAVDVLAEVCGE